MWVPLASVESSCIKNGEVKLSPRGDSGEDNDELIRQTLQIDELVRQSLDGVSESTSSMKEQAIEVDDYLDFIYEGLSKGSSDVEATPATSKAKAQQLAMITGSAHFIKDWGEDEQSEKVDDHKAASTSCVVVDGDNAMSQYEDVISANVTFSENIEVAQAVEAEGGREQRKRDLEAVICAERSHSSGSLADQGRLDKKSDEVKENKDAQKNVITGFNPLREGEGNIEKIMTINDSKDTCSVATSKCSELNDGNGTALTQATRNKNASRLEIIKGGANFVKHWGKDEQCERAEDQDACSVATSKCGEINGGNGTARTLFTRNTKGRQLKMINARANLIKRWGKNGYSEKDEDGKENDEYGAANTPGKKNAKNTLAMIIGRANFIGKGEMYEKVEDNKNSCSDLSNCENSASGNKENNTLPATRSAKMNNAVRVLTCENKFKGNVKPRGKIKDKVAHKVNGVQAVRQDKHDTNAKRSFHEEADAAIAAAAAAAAAMGSKEAISGRSYSATTIVKTGSSQQINHGPSLSHTHDEVQEAEAGLDKVISRSSDAMIYIQKSGSSQNTPRSKSAFPQEVDAAGSATTTADVGIKHGSTIRVVPGSPATCNSAYFGMEALYSDSLVTNISDEGDGSFVCLFSDSLVTNNSDEDHGFIETTTLQVCADAPDRLANESEAEVAVVTGDTDEDEGFIGTTTLQACADTPDRLAKESEAEAAVITGNNVVIDEDDGFIGTTTPPTCCADASDRVTSEPEEEVAFEAAAETGNKAVIRQKSGSNQKTYRRKSPFHYEADAALAAAATAKAAKENMTILIVVPDSPEACNTEKSETENGAANSQTIEEDGSEFDGLDTNMIDEDDGFVGTATLLASASEAGRATDEQPMADEENVDESIHLDPCPATEPFARAPSPATASTNAAPPRPQLKIDHIQLIMPYLVNYGAQTYQYPPPPLMHYQYYHGGVGGQNIPQYYYASAPQTTQFYQ